MTDPLFSQLFACEWRSGGGHPAVQFPIVSVHVEMQQDLAEHKFWGLDSAHVEATGRCPMVISVEIPFVNGIVPGKNEKWGVLYPTAFRQFLAATFDRATGEFVHPELGLINCKVKSVSTELRATQRDGVVVHAVFVETLLEDEVALGVDTDSPITTAALAALDLDASIRDINPPLPVLPKYKPDFAAFMRSIAAVGDQVSLMEQRSAGRIDAIAYRLDAIDDSVTRVKATTPLPKKVKDVLFPDVTARARAALAWPVRQSTGVMRDSLYNSREKLLENGRGILKYTVAKPATLASISVSVGAPVTELMALNPRLLAAPVVPKDSVVRYYSRADR